MIRPFFGYDASNSSPLPLAGEADALGRARRVGALTAHTEFSLGTPTPPSPARAGEGEEHYAAASFFGGKRP
jgi:hypothetical protein